ncbi:MAG: hypothetical protein ABEK50_17520 [bacterium]
MFPDTTTFVIFIALGLGGLAEMGYLLYRISRRSQWHERYRQDMELLYQNLEEHRDRVPGDFFEQQKQILTNYLPDKPEESS